MSELKKFKLVNKIEGYSYLILLFIAMPMKYALGYPVATKIAGMTHGLLVFAFIYFVLEVIRIKGITGKEGILYFIFSLIPFGSFYTDKKLKEKLAATTPVETK